MRWIALIALVFMPGSVIAQSSGTVGYNRTTKVTAPTNLTFKAESITAKITNASIYGITGILKGDGLGGSVAATPGTDYQSPISGTPLTVEAINTQAEFEALLFTLPSGGGDTLWTNTGTAIQTVGTNWITIHPGGALSISGQTNRLSVSGGVLQLDGSPITGGGDTIWTLVDDTITASSGAADGNPALSLNTDDEHTSGNLVEIKNDDVPIFKLGFGGSLTLGKESDPYSASTYPRLIMSVDTNSHPAGANTALIMESYSNTDYGEGWFHSFDTSQSSRYARYFLSAYEPGVDNRTWNLQSSSISGSQTYFAYLASSDVIMRITPSIEGHNIPYRFDTDVTHDSGYLWTLGNNRTNQASIDYLGRLSLSGQTNLLSIDSGVLKLDGTAIGGFDADAIHSNVSGEIALITDKATPVAADHLLIEDSAASDAKKDITIASLETALEGFLDLQDLQGAVTDGQIPAAIARDSEVAARIDNAPYDSVAWNNVSTIAPSQDAVRDEIELLILDIASKVSTTSIDTSAEIAAIVGDETGTGALVFAESPTFTAIGIGEAPISGTQLTVKGANTSSGSYNFRINDSSSRGLLYIDNNGRFDMYNYSGGGGIGVLGNHLVAPPVGTLAGHWAWAAYDGTGLNQQNTLGRMDCYITDTNKNSLDSQLKFWWMEDVDDSPGGTYAYQQPNKSLTIDRDGFTFPNPLLLGTTPATVGQIRIPNNTLIAARNAANSADVVLGTVATDNGVYIGSGSSLVAFIANGATRGYFATSGLNWSANNTYDIGTSSVAGRSGYFATGLNAAAGVFTNTLTLGGVSVATVNDLSSGYQPLDSDLTALAGNSSNGHLVRTGSGTVAARTITGDSEITVSNGDGVSGNPTLAIASGLTRDTEWDTIGEIETAIGGVNVLLETEIDASSELAALMDDETGTGLLVFNANPTLDRATITTTTANAQSLTISGGSTTGSGTGKAVTISHTVNSSGVQDGTVSIAITETAAGAGSKYFKVSGGASGTTDLFSVERLGAVVTAGGITAGGNVSNASTAGAGFTASGAGNLVFSGAAGISTNGVGSLRMTDASGVVTNTAFSFGLRVFPAAAKTLASAATIAPLDPLTFISGTTTIDTITVPPKMAATGGQITLIPTAVWATSTSGNIALVTTAVVSKALILFYDPATAKWYPSY